jgi:alanine-glyoxylate transaminase / serine-glyoxylate transaminase / serine-pyruvate transaminase
MSHRTGRHFLQIPGPTNVPERILLAMASATIDHRGPHFARMAHEILEDLKPIFKTTQSVVVYPSSGTGAWESALVNTLSPGDKVLAFETGQFASQWRDMASRLGLNVQFVSGDWRHGASPEAVGAHLDEDRGGQIKAVMVVHNETSTGVTSRIPAIREAMNRTRHPALLLVDAISSLGSIDYRHDEWGVDVTVAGSQKGLMLPPGLSFNAISEKALEASRSSRFAKSYWDWQPMLEANQAGLFPYTPATNLLYGLRESLRMLTEEGLDNVFARHNRHAEATRLAVETWGLEVLCLDPREYSSSLTAVLLKPGRNADEFRKLILEHFNMSLGNGLGKLQGKVFRIGHLGDFNDLMMAGTLSGIEMGLKLAGISYARSGVAAALDYLAGVRQEAPAGAVQEAARV